jgi:hypothetical protein
VQQDRDARHELVGVGVVVEDQLGERERQRDVDVVVPRPHVGLGGKPERIEVAVRPLRAVPVADRLHVVVGVDEPHAGLHVSR